MIRRLTVHDWIMLTGSALVSLGVFLPIVQMPIVGTLTYFAGGKGIGVYVLLMAGVTAGLVVCGFRFVAPYVGIGLSILILTTLLRMYGIVAGAQVDYLQFSNGAAGKIARIAAENTHLGWGWLPLVGGAALIVWGGFVAPVRSLYPNVTTDGQAELAEDTKLDLVQKADANSRSFPADFDRRNNASASLTRTTFGRRRGE